MADAPNSGVVRRHDEFDDGCDFDIDTSVAAPAVAPVVIVAASAGDAASEDDTSVDFESPARSIDQSNICDDIRANPELLQREEYASLRNFFGYARDRYPLENSDEVSRVGNTPTEAEAVVECFCSLGGGQLQEKRQGGGGNTISSDQHSDECLSLQPLRRRVLEEEGRGFSSQSHDALHELAHELRQRSRLDRSDELSSNNVTRMFQEQSIRYFSICLGYAPSLVNLMVFDEIPFLLVETGRYDELCTLISAYSRGWASAQTTEWKQKAREGDITFGTIKNACLVGIDELYNCCVPFWEQNHAETLTFLVSYFFMKLRLLSERSDEREQWANGITIMLNETISGKVLSPVKFIILEMATSKNDYHDPLEDQLPRIMDVIDGRNPTILPALVHPDPLNGEIDSLGLPLHPVLLPRTPAEAHTALANCDATYKGIPLARTVLVKRYGESPRYHHAPFDYTASDANFVP